MMNALIAAQRRYAEITWVLSSARNPQQNMTKCTLYTCKSTFNCIFSSFISISRMRTMCDFCALRKELLLALVRNELVSPLFDKLSLTIEDVIFPSSSFSMSIHTRMVALPACSEILAYLRCFHRFSYDEANDGFPGLPMGHEMLLMYVFLCMLMLTSASFTVMPYGRIDLQFYMQLASCHAKCAAEVCPQNMALYLLLL